MTLCTFGFVGLGLIGGSLARALRRAYPNCSIMAYTRSPGATTQALAEGVINYICTSLRDPAFARCDMIFLCTPVGSNIEALRSLKDLVPDTCILTDVGSVKTDIHEAVHEMGLDGRFIGGHPMTGSEKSGYSSSAAHLFENSYYIITPSEASAPEQVETCRALASSIGAIPIVLDYRTHDFATAAVSHLPHLIAAALVNTVHRLDTEDELMKLIAAGGFKDITRIASSSPEMWEQICLANRENISRVMDTFLELLQASRSDMNAGDGAAVHEMFESSRNYRNSFSSASLGSIKKTYSVYCDIVDESGAIAVIATMLAIKGISIKNIGIVHNREFEEGALKIDFHDEETARQAAEILEQNRYRIQIR